MYQFIHSPIEGHALLLIGNYELDCCEHSSAGVCVDMFPTHLGKYQGTKLLDRMVKVRSGQIVF